MLIGQYNGYHILSVGYVKSIIFDLMKCVPNTLAISGRDVSGLCLVSSEVNLPTASAGLFTLRQCLISYNHSQYSSNIGHEPNNLVHCKGQVMQRCVSFWTLPFGAARVFIWSKLSLLLIGELSGKPRFCSLLGYLI